MADPKATTPKEFAAIIRTTNARVLKGHRIALLETGVLARKLAIINAKRQFKGNPKIGRKLTGQLLKSIKVKFDVTDKGGGTAFLTVEGIPYGAIQEFGGIIRPKPGGAKHLWVKTDYRGKFKRMTPTDFFNMRAKQRADNRARPRQKKGDRFRRTRTFDVFKSKKGNLIAAQVDHLKTKLKIRTLFALKDSVKIPARPYLRPAANLAGKVFVLKSKKRIKEQLEKK